MLLQIVAISYVPKVTINRKLSNMGKKINYQANFSTFTSDQKHSTDSCRHIYDSVSYVMCHFLTNSPSCVMWVFFLAESTTPSPNELNRYNNAILWFSPSIQNSRSSLTFLCTNLNAF